MGLKESRLVLWVRNGRSIRAPNHRIVLFSTHDTTVKEHIGRFTDCASLSLCALADGRVKGTLSR